MLTYFNERNIVYCWILVTYNTGCSWSKVVKVLHHFDPKRWCNTILRSFDYGEVARLLNVTKLSSRELQAMPLAKFFLFSGRLCFIKYTIVPLFSPDPPEDSCPPLRPMPGCSLVKNYCTDDSQCADGEKCCLRKDCIKRCSTLAKAGKCHKTDPKPCPAILRPHECTTDWDCAGEQKCCSDGCIKKCTSLFVTPFEGIVWFSNLKM